MSFTLRVTSGKAAGQEFSFSQKVVCVGRLPDNDLVLYDTGVSRHHCQITREGSSYVVHDVGSANGFELNGRLTTEAQLASGDVLKVGAISLEFSLSSDTQKIEPAVLEAEETSKGSVLAPPSEALRRAVEEQKTGLFPTIDPRTLEPVPAGLSKVASDPAAKLPMRRPSPEQRAQRSSREAAKAAEHEATPIQQASVRDRVERMRARWQALPKPRRQLFITAGVVAVAVVALALLVHWLRPPQDRSSEVFNASRENALLTFGAGKVDVFTPDRVSFGFPYSGGRVVVAYAAGGIDSESEVLILANGERVGAVPVSPGRWTPGLHVVLPRRLLRRGENTVTFDAQPQGDEAPRWGVSAVTITETTLPPPDFERAKHLFELGNSTFEVRNVTPQNLSRAIGYYEEARTWLEGAEPEPPLLTAVHAALAKAETELAGIYETHMFAVEQALRFGERQRAVDSLRDVLQWVPNPEDARHVRAKARLTELVGQAGER